VHPLLIFRVNGHSPLFCQRDSHEVKKDKPEIRGKR